ncbi:MAG: hypothetical protein AB8I08_34510 [Sandaracinaceae bacterium]
MRHFTPAFLLLALSLIGCNDSHSRDDCAGDVPDCLMGAEGSASCCIAGTESSATCMSGEWVCAGGSYRPSECGRIDSACEGPMNDGGLRPCDAGPIANCLRGYDGSADCCLTGDTVPAMCGATGGVRCPSGYFFETACGRTGPMCEGVDAGGPPPGLYDDCSATSECALTIDSCCGSCGVPARGDVAAVNTERADDHYRDVACPASAEGPVDCPACAGQADPHLTATCDMTGFRPQCAVVDFAASPYSDCETAEDCVLVAPTCCPCGDIDASQTISVNRDQAGQVHAVTCDDAAAACDACAPNFAPDLTPVCNAGRCEVLRGDIGG